MLSYNPAESAVLITSDADGGTYELYLVPKDAASGREPSPVRPVWGTEVGVEGLGCGQWQQELVHSLQTFPACKGPSCNSSMCGWPRTGHGLVGGLLMPRPCT